MGKNKDGKEIKISKENISKLSYKGVFMQNPFESGHIKNYLLLYASVVVIMILFFIAATLFRDTKLIKEKVFNTEQKEVKKSDLEKKTPQRKFKLMEKNY